MDEREFLDDTEQFLTADSVGEKASHFFDRVVEVGIRQPDWISYHTEKDLHFSIKHGAFAVGFRKTEGIDGREFLNIDVGQERFTIPYPPQVEEIWNRRSREFTRGYRKKIIEGHHANLQKVRGVVDELENLL